jgi:hypothetical protein
MGHYLSLQLTLGKDSFERVYVELTAPDEPLQSAVDRWLDAQVAGRKRNVAKARRAAEARIEHARIARPTSWHREHETGAFTPPGKRKKRRRGRAGA